MTARLILFLLPLAAWADLPQASVSPPPGRYASAVTVAVTVPEGTSVLYRFLESPDQRDLPWTSPLTLDALPGETRSSTLRLTTQLPTGEAVVKDFAYTIARPVSRFPTVRPVPGTYASKVELQPSLPEGWTLTEDGAPAAAAVLDAPDGGARTYVFEARGQGQSAVWTYTIDRRDQDAALDILSPAAGAWANAQQLLLSFRGLDRVVWSYGDSIDGEGTEYAAPVMLKTGAQSVTVAGRTRDGRWLERRVSWTAGQADVPPGWPTPGVRNQPADFPAAEGWTFSWDEGRSWQAEAHHEDAPALSRKLVVVQAKTDAAVSRLVYWFDAHTPQQPELRFEGGWNPKLIFSGSPDALYRVVWTGSDKQTKTDTPLWGPIGSWKIPDGMVSALVTASAPNGTSAETTLEFAETGWAVPQWEAWDPGAGSKFPAGGRVVPRPGFLAAYEVASSPDVPEPTAASPWLDGAFLPSVPWGADRTFYVRFAWRDAAGLTGPASPVYSVRVDKLPPPLPAVSESGGQIVVSGGGDANLFWAVTPQRAADAGAVDFQPYRGPIDRAPLVGQWFHARAQDAFGNVGPARLNVVLTGTPTGIVQVDTDPALGETPVADGGVYPWHEFRLRSEIQGLWVGAADPGTGVPPTWAAELRPWTGLFTQAFPGGRHGVLLYWNQKTADGWAWPQPKTLTLTLDQGPAAAPVLSDWPSAPLSQPWTLTMKPGQDGDTLRYTATLDGSTPPDPAASGQPWPGSRTWEAPEGTVTTLLIRAAAVSVSGQTTEIPLSPVRFDRRPGPLAAVPLELFTYRNSPASVSGAPGTVRYTLTADGSTPAVPDAGSPLVGDGITLAGTEGQTVLYRFRWRAYSPSGEPGPPTDTYSVLVDRTQSTPLSSGAVPEQAPLVTGLPKSGVSASPVTVQVQGPGTLRYELQEGAGVPPAVTSGSPLWTQPLTLGAEGLDRTYTLKVRGFSASGQPSTDETQYAVRVDQAAPGLPEFNVTADAQARATVTAADQPDEKLEYRCVWQSYPRGGGDGVWTPLTSAAVFSAPDGEMTRLTVQARWRDEVGNVGPVAEKTVLLDQNVVYLASGASGDGSRGSPVGTVAAALQLARTSGRGIVFAASGNYPVNATADLGGLRVYGSWSSGPWEAAPNAGRTVWTQAPGFQGTALIRTSRADWVLEGVDVFAAQGTAQVVSVEGGSAAVRDSSWTWGGSGIGWSQSGGLLELTNVSAVYNAVPRGSFLSLDSVSAVLNGLNLAAGGNQESLLIDCRAAAVKAADLVIVSKDSVGYDGVWQSDGGSLTVSGARILAGAGAGRSLAFRLKNTDASVSRLDLSLFGSASNTASQLTGGSVKISQSSFSLLRGSEFNQAVVADHGATSLDGFAVKIDSGAYQGAFNLDGGSLTLASGSVVLSGGGLQAWGGRFRGASLVSVSGVTWALTQKTPGKLWLIDVPWADGSSVTNSPSSGW